MVQLEVLPGDEHYLWFCAIITVALQLSCFAIAFSCKFDTITDFSGSTNFVLLALLTLSFGGWYHTRQVVLTVLLTVSRLELALFLLYRVCKRKRDARFDEVRENCGKFLVFWIYQIVWVYVVSLPVIRVNSTAANPDLGVLDVLGWLVWLCGFALQFVSDMQKLRFRADPANRFKVCDSGLWAYSRHPNYCGEILMWWGIFLSSASVWSSVGAGWPTIASPIFTMLILLFLTGMPTAEGAALARYYEAGDAVKAEYEAYRQRTSPILPCLPSLYGSLPACVKCTFCCEFPFYRYSPQPKGETNEALA